MTVPTAYDESTLADFMVTALGTVAADLGLVAAAFAESVNDVLLAYGENDIADATNIALLRALGRVAAWKVALTTAATFYDVSDGTQSLKRSQMLTGIKATLSAAESDAAPLLAEAGVGGMVATVSTLVFTEDPYNTALLAEQAAALS